MSCPPPTPDFRDHALPALVARPIEPHWPLGVAAQVAVLREVGALMEQRRAVVAGEDVEAVHRLRVACRRLRGAMDGLADLWPKKPLRALRKELSALARAFGRARDLDVEAERWAARTDATRHDEHERALRWLWSRVGGARRAEQGQLLAALASAEEADLYGRLVAFFAATPCDLEAFAAQLGDEQAAPFGPVPEAAPQEASTADEPEPNPHPLLGPPPRRKRA